jgi:hypothetical protein
VTLTGQLTHCPVLSCDWSGKSCAVL